MRYREFQRLFDLTVDGIIGKATWYRIGYLYTAVKRLAELDSEGIALEEIPQQYPRLLQEGDTGDEVRVIQYYLAVIGDFYNTVPPISVTGTFDQATREAVVAFQNTYGLTPDGIVGRLTWNDMYRAYRGIVESSTTFEGGVALYPAPCFASALRGTTSGYCSSISPLFPRPIPPFPPCRIPGFSATRPRPRSGLFRSSSADGQRAGGPLTWDAIASLYSDLRYGYNKQPGQYPGYELNEGE